MSRSGPGPTAELIVSGRIASLDGPVGFGWVEAVAIADRRVVAAGSRAERRRARRAADADRSRSNRRRWRSPG